MNPIQLELWQLICLLLAFFGCVAAFGKILLGQFEKRLDERFKTQEDSRKTAQVHWDESFKKIETMSRQNERDILQLQAKLPEHYLRREDWIRSQSTIEAKIDGLATKFENILLRERAGKDSQS